jgi:hypothetical protein
LVWSKAGGSVMGSAAAFMVVVKLRSASPLMKMRRIIFERDIFLPQRSTDFTVKFEAEGHLRKNLQSSIE